MISVFDRVENFVGKGENAGYHDNIKSFLFPGPENLGLCRGELLFHFISYRYFF